MGNKYYDNFLKTKEDEKETYRPTISTLPVSEKSETYKKIIEQPKQVSPLKKEGLLGEPRGDVRSQDYRDKYRELYSTVKKNPLLARKPIQPVEVPGYTQHKMGELFGMGGDDVLADEEGRKFLARYENASGWRKINPFDDIHKELGFMQDKGHIKRLATAFGTRIEETPIIAGYGANLSGLIQTVGRINKMTDAQFKAVENDPLYKAAAFTAKMQTTFMNYFAAGQIALDTNMASRIGASKVAKALGKIKLPKYVSGNEYTKPLAQWLGDGGLVNLASIQGTALFIDTVVRTPEEIMTAISEDMTLSDATKYFLEQRGIDVAFNFAFDTPRLLKEFKYIAKGNEEVANSIRTMMGNEMEKATARVSQELDSIARKAYFTNVPSPEYQAREAIFNGMDKQLMEGLEYQAKMAKQIETESFTNFDLWRKNNFGDSLGRAGRDDLVDEEFAMLKQWFKNDTGIDLDTVTVEARKLQETIDNIVDLGKTVDADTYTKTARETVADAVDTATIGRLSDDKIDYVFRHIPANPTDINNLSMAIKEIDILEEETRTLLDMDLQLFAKGQLKKHQKLLAELKTKGVSKLSKNEVESLIAVKDSIRGIKEANKEAVKEAVATRVAKIKTKASRTTLENDTISMAKRLKNAEKTMPNELRLLSQEITNTVDTVARRLTPGAKIKYELLESIEKVMKDLDPSYIPDKKIRAKVERLARRQIGNYTDDELVDLQDTMNGILHQFKTYKKNKMASDLAVLEVAKSDIETEGFVEGVGFAPRSKITEGVDTARVKKDKVVAFHSDPKRAVKAITGWEENSQMMTTFERNATLGKERADQWMFDVADRFAEISDGIGPKDLKGIYKATLDNGMVIEVDNDTKLTLIAGWDDIGFRRHVKEGVGGGAGRYVEKGKSVKYTFTQADIDNMIASMTDAEKKYLKAYKDLANPDSLYTKGINNVYLKDTGHDLELVSEYMPIYTDKMYRNANITSGGGRSLGNMSFVQERVDASMPIVVEPLSQVTERMVNTGKNYVAYREASKQMEFVLGQQSFRRVVHDKYGQTYLTYFEDLVANLNGNKGLFDSASGLKKGYVKTLAKSKGAVLMANVGTGLKQIPSVVTAIPEFGVEYAPHILKPFTPAKAAIMDKFAPSIRLRNTGQIGDLAHYMSTLKSTAQKKPGLFMRMGDRIAMGGIWNMAEANVKDLYPELTVGSDEFYKKVARLTQDAVYDTQLPSSLMQRSPAGRPSDIAEALYGMFGGQTRKNMNILYEAKNTFGKNPTKAIEQVLSVAIQGAMIAGITYKTGKLFDKDKSYDEELLKTYTTLIPGGRQAISAILYKQGTGSLVEGHFLDMVRSLENLVQFKESKVTALGAFKDVVFATATLTGKPVNNVERQFKMLLKKVSPKMLYDYENLYRKSTSSARSFQAVYDSVSRGDFKGNESFVEEIKKNINPSSEEGEQYKSAPFDRIKSSMVSKVNSGKLDYSDEKIKEILKHFEDANNKVEDLPEYLTIPAKKKALEEFGLDSDAVDKIRTELPKIKTKKEKIRYLRLNYPGKPAELIYDILY